jgi:RNA polymerase sigma-70 factor (ECF subfamily)
VKDAQQAEFVRLSEPHRRELLAHCYRMLGSLDDAEDAVQETLLRAWRGYGGFEGRASMRTWLYRIATNVCLNAIERHRAPRVLPSGLGAPAPSGDVQPDEDAEVAWLQPIPDALIAPESEDPAAVVAARESVRLALLTGLQVLPARQRAVLILREVLGFHAAEVAEMLDTSVAAVKSTLQRARGTLAASQEPVEEPSDAESRALLADYIAAFERSDITRLERALRKDAALEMVGSRTWFAGVETCLRYIARFLGRPGDWRMVPTSANGQPATVTYYKGEPFGVAVLTTTPTGITRIVVWGDPALPSRFGAD